MWLPLFILILSYLLTGTVKNFIACWKMLSDMCDEKEECKCNNKKKLSE